MVEADKDLMSFSPLEEGRKEEGMRRRESITKCIHQTAVAINKLLNSRGASFPLLSAPP
jgi:hypothetical protein